MDAELDFDAHHVGYVGLSRAARFAGPNDAVLREEVEVVVDVVDVAVETLDERADAVGEALPDGFEEFRPAIRQEGSQLEGVPSKWSTWGTSSPFSQRSTRSWVAACAHSAGRAVI